MGAILLALGTVYLVLGSLPSPVATASFTVFGIAAIFLFTSSTIYHWGSEERTWLQRLDHSAIYVMIAGSYTPIALLALPNPQNWIVLVLQWSLAIFGVVFTVTRKKTPTWLRLTLYLVMGWMLLAFVQPLLNHTTLYTVVWLFAGGFVYTLGSIIYATKRPNLWPGKFSSHELWHLFVLGGAACHFAMMLGLAK